MCFILFSQQIQTPPLPPANLGPSHHPVMPNITIDTNGCNKLLSNIKPHKAAGPDGVATWVLKELKDATTPVLTDIFQKSLDSGELPADWREAHIAAVYKKGEWYKDQFIGRYHLRYTSIVA